VDIKENLIARRKVLEALKKRFSRKRKGWHVSDLITCPRRVYFREIGEYEFMQDERVLLYTAGIAHHDLLEYLPLREIPVEKDGIRGTIDLIGDRVTEIYTTRASSKKSPEEFILKIEQLKSYLCMAGETEGDLMILFLMGDYANRTPDIKVYTMSCSKDELEEHWRKIVKRKNMLEYCIKNRKMPEEMGEGWMCKNCGYKHICGVAGGLEMIRKESERVKKEMELIKGEA